MLTPEEKRAFKRWDRLASLLVWLSPAGLLKQKCPECGAGLQIFYSADDTRTGSLAVHCANRPDCPMASRLDELWRVPRWADQMPDGFITDGDGRFTETIASGAGHQAAVSSIRRGKPTIYILPPPRFKRSYWLIIGGAVLAVIVFLFSQLMVVWTESMALYGPDPWAMMMKEQLRQQWAQDRIEQSFGCPFPATPSAHLANSGGDTRGTCPYAWAQVWATTGQLTVLRSAISTNEWVYGPFTNMTTSPCKARPEPRFVYMPAGEGWSREIVSGTTARVWVSSDEYQVMFFYHFTIVTGSLTRAWMATAAAAARDAHPPDVAVLPEGDPRAIPLTQAREMLEERGVPYRSLIFTGDDDQDLCLIFGRPGETVPFEDTSLLADLPIDVLWLTGALVTNIEPLAGMPIKELSLRGTSISDLTGVNSMKKLTHLDIGCTRVTDLSPLENASIEHLTMDYVAATNFAAVRSLHLKSLDAGHTPISDMSLLVASPLETLNITETDVADLQPLAGHLIKELRFDPAAITNGMDIIRNMETIETIGVGSFRTYKADEFWEAYDAGDSVAHGIPPRVLNPATSTNSP